MKFKWIRLAVLTVLLSGGIWHSGEGAYIYARAQLAQKLIHDAWQESFRHPQQVKPWSWADTWPVARLMVPRLNVDLIVLAGDNGRTLAFGPGHRFGTTAPGEIGNSLIAGHRDTHFNFLKSLYPGEEIFVQTRNGSVQVYSVNSTQVIHESTAVEETSGHRQLTLVTCYPFDALVAGGSLRYIVIAIEKDVAEAGSMQSHRISEEGMVSFSELLRL